jgi:hypothetical protein
MGATESQFDRKSKVISRVVFLGCTSQFCVKGLSKQLTSDTMCCRLVSFIPSATIMQEHNRKHGSTNNRFMDKSFMDMMFEKILQECYRKRREEKFAAVLGQLYGTSITNPGVNGLPWSIPSGTIMGEHKRKRDSTTDDDNW